MTLSVLAAFAGALVAAVGTGVLAGRCIRRPRIDIIAWTVAMFGLTVALGAQTLGFGAGFNGATFRAIQLGAQLVAPLLLAWGLIELTAKSLPARFGARLVVSALIIVAGVILATDPLAGKAFSKAWPTAAVHYQLIPHSALNLVHLVAVGAVLVAGIVAVARARTEPAWHEALIAVAALGVALLLIIGLRFNLPVNTAYPALTALAAALVWVGTMRASKLRLAVLHGTAQGRLGGGPGGRPPGASEAASSAGGRGRRPDWQDQPRGPGRAGREDWASGPDGFDGQGPPDRLDHLDTGYPLPPLDDADGYDRFFRDDGRAGVWQPRGQGRAPVAALPAGQSEVAIPGHPGAAEAPPARLYGLITIYTLIDERVDDFDRLVERAAGEVRVQEPDTLVYNVHMVPKAPMQRIFYEIYRDRSAYDHHERQPYIQRFVAERRPYVLATNVIELRLRHAKVSPLPALSRDLPARRPGAG